MPKKKRQPPKTYAFIDTNIFLDFYRAKNDSTINLLKKLDSVKDRIICTYQVEMEFLKNRQKEILKIAEGTNLTIDTQLPAVFDNSLLNRSLKTQKKDLEIKKKQLKRAVEKLISTPNQHDPIWSTLTHLFNSPSDHVLTRDMKLRHKMKRLAWRRFVLGYPPRKSNDTSIGDALNWEWFVHCASTLKGKFLLVTRDSDFGTEYQGKCFLNDQLKSEFQERVGKKPIHLVRKLSEALSQLEVYVTDEEKESENKEITAIGSSTIQFYPNLVNALGEYDGQPWDEFRNKIIERFNLDVRKFNNNQ